MLSNILTVTILRFYVDFLLISLLCVEGNKDCAIIAFYLERNPQLYRTSLKCCQLFYSETGQSCAIKEVVIIPDNDKSMESAKQLMQVLILKKTFDGFMTHLIVWDVHIRIFVKNIVFPVSSTF